LNMKSGLKRKENSMLFRIPLATEILIKIL
jgi:hypothetical protein